MACVNTNEKSFKELISKYGASSGTVENAIKIYMDKNNLETYDPNSPDFINHMDSYFQLESNNFYSSKGEYNRIHALWEKINPKQDIADIKTATKEYNTLVGIFGEDNVTIFETSSGRFRVRTAEPMFGDGITSDNVKFTVEYTPIGKSRQTYTIRGNKIFNKEGKEVFKTDSVDRNRIFANLAVQQGRAVVVNYKNKKYVVNNRNQIISVTTGKIMQWDEKNGDRNAIIKAAQEKFNSNKSKSQKQQLKFETTAEVQAYLKQKYASNSSNAKLTDLVFAALNKFNIKFKSVDIKSEDGHSAISGKFVASKNTIEINSNPEFIRENTILHEAIHAVTSYYLKAASTNGFPQEIQIAIKEINECYKLLKQDFIETHFYKNGKLNPEVNVEAAFDFWISGSNDLYGYTSPNEMVAELSNPNFVQHIKDFDNRHKGKNIFQRLIDAIASLFGINKSYGSLEGTLKKALTTLLTNPSEELAERYNRENTTIKENVNVFLKSRHIIISSNKIEQDIISQLPEEDSTDKDYFDVTIKTPKDLANFVFSTSKEGANHIFTKSHKGDIYTTSSGLHMVLVAPVEITENEFIHKLRVLNSTALSLNKFNIAQGESGIDYITDIDNIISRKEAYFNSLKSEAVFNWGRTSDNNYEVSSAGDSRFSAFDAKLKPGTKILGVTVPEEKSTFIAGKPTTTNSIEYVYQTLIKKSSKGGAPSKDSKLYMPYNYKNAVPFIRQLALLGRFAVPSNNLEEVRKADSKRDDISKITKKSKSYTILQSLLEFNKFADVDVSQLDVSEATKDRIKEVQRKFKNTTAYDSVSTIRITEDEAKIRATEFRDMYSIYTPLIQDIVREVWGVELSTSPITYSALDLTPSGKSELLQSKEEKEDFSYYVGYLPLWQEWARQNPELIEELRTKAAGKTLTDQFAYTRVSQARALADILNSTNAKSEAVEEAPNISLSTVGYKKGDPQRNPNTDYVFTENAEAYAYSNGTDLSPFGVKFPNPNKPKINVSDVSGTNQAGIRTDNNGNISQNAYGIVVKKYQQDANGRFVAKEGQFQNTEEDFKLFTSLNEDMFDRLSKSSNKEIVFPTQMGLGKAALPLRFAEWLKNELENRFGIVSKIEKNTRADYDGFGLKLLSVKQSQNSESEAVEEAPIFEEENDNMQSAKELVDRMIADSKEHIKFNPEDHSYIVDGRKADTSVTQFIHGKQDLGKWGTPSSAIGTTADTVTRDFFKGELKDSYPNLSKEDLAFLKNDLRKLKAYFDERFGEGNYRVVTTEFPIAAKYTYTDNDGNTKVGIMAGTMDMLIYDNEGNFYIYDMKTSRSGLNENKVAGYAQQLTFYKAILEAKYPELKGKIKELKLIQFRVGYPAPGENFVYSSDSNNQLYLNGTPIQEVEEYSAPYLDFTGKTLDNQVLIPVKPVSTKVQFEDLTEEEVEAMKEEVAQPESTESTESEVDNQRGNLYGNPLLSASERTFLANNVMCLTSLIITHLQTDKRANQNYFEDQFKNVDFTTMSREDIINTVGISRIFNYIRERWYNTENRPDIEDFDVLDKLDLAYNNWTALVKSAYPKLISLEGVTVVNTRPEEISLEDIETAFQEGIDSGELEEKEREYWQQGIKNISARASLSTDIRRTFGRLFAVDAQGHPIKDKFGFNFDTFVDPGLAVNSIFEWTTTATTMEEMETQLEGLREAYPWLNSILDKVKQEPFRSQFFQNFRKDFTQYSIVTVSRDERGNKVYKVQIINTKGATQSILDEITSYFNSGLMQNIIISADGIEGKGRVNVKNVEALKARKDAIISSLKEAFGSIRKDAYIAAVQKNIPEITKLLNEIGIRVDTKTVSNSFNINSRPKDINNTPVMKMLEQMTYMFDTLLSKKDAIDYNPLLKGEEKNIYGNYKSIVGFMSKYIQDSIESSCYENGKMYYSFNTPSYMGKLILNLKDAIGNYDKFESFMEDNYGSYRWFKNEDGSWNNPWLELLNSSETYRQNLEHKVQLSFDNTDYRDLSELGYTLSLMNEYFYDNSKKKWAWYRVPMLSNKPSSEFIRFTRYSGRNYQKTIKRGLRKILNQEILRFKAVLERSVNPDIETIKNFDISSKTLKNNPQIVEKLKAKKPLTHSDLVKNGKLVTSDSGASFKFLESFNLNIIAGDELGMMIIDKLNGVDVNEDTFERLVDSSLDSYMKIKVAEEFRQWEKIGLFETEEVKRGNDTEVSYKYIPNLTRSYSEIRKELFGDSKKSSKERQKLTKEQKSEILSVMRQEADANLTEYIWNDMFATINIIELTATDLAYYANVEDFQKRYAQVHSPALRLNITAKFKKGSEEIPYSADGLARTIYVADYKTESDIIPNVEEIFDQKIASITDPTEKANMKIMKDLILDSFKDVNVTDAQGYSSPTSYRKKMGMQGKWTTEMEEAYERIRKGDFNVNDLGIVWQPMKPFVYSQIRKPGGSSTLSEIKVPIQNKNSEYLLLLADALMRGGKKQSKLAAIFDFMEESAYDGRKTSFNPKTNTYEVIEEGTYNGIGIDTVQFNSAVKSGESGVIDINSVDSYEDVKKILNNAVYLNSDRTAPADNNHDRYNANYVHTYSFEDYGIQQEVPAHLADHEQLMGSQMRILSISDITPGTKFQVGDRTLESDKLIEEYQNLIKENIEESFNQLCKDFKIHGTRLERNKALERILQEAIEKDQRYGADLQRACSLDSNGEFIIPLSDPIQSVRIQQLLNSIIKSRINKQKVSGGPVVQASVFGMSDDLTIRFKDKEGNLIESYNEFIERKGLQRDEKSYKEYKNFIDGKQGSVAYFECYMPIPSAEIEKALTKYDSNGHPYIMSVDEAVKEGILNEEMLQAIGYRIPTEDKYSMIPMKIKGFLPKAAGEALMLPKEITLLTGSDFDVDKIYVMLKTFEYKERTNWSQLKKDFLNTKNVKGEERKKLKNDLDIAVAQIVAGMSFSEDDFEMEVHDYYSDNKSKYKKSGFELVKKGTSGRNNKIFDLQWAVLTNADTMSKMFNPGSFDVQKKTARIVRILQETTGHTYKELSGLTVKQLDDILNASSNKNIIFSTSQVYFHKQNMTAGKLIGIFANNNTSHAFISMQGIDLKLEDDLKFTFDGVTIDKNQNNRLDPLKGKNGSLISKTIAGFLAASVDAVKDPVLNFMNLNTFTAGSAMVLARLGFDSDSIGLLLSQPIIIKLTNEYLRRNNEGYISTDDLIDEYLEQDKNSKGYESTITLTNFTKEELAEGISLGSTSGDFQIRALILFKRLSKIATELNTLTFLTKFNSVTNAVGPTIADTLVMKQRYSKFLDKFRDGTAIFSDNAADVIQNSPILDAFYTTTISDTGASQLIFQDYFPQYSDKFIRVLDRFRETTKASLDSKTINSLVNDFVLYKLTGGPNPVLNSDRKIRKEFIYDFIKEFKERAAGIIDNDLLKIITVKPVTERCPVTTLEAKIGGYTQDVQERVKDAWTNLIANKKTRDLGVKLFFYNMYRTGVSFSPKTFLSLASTDVKLAIPGYIESIRDINYNNTFDVDDFLLQYRRNHTDNYKVVPHITQRNGMGINLEEDGARNKKLIFTFTSKSASAQFIVKKVKNGKRADLEQSVVSPVIVYNNKVYYNPYISGDSITYTETTALGNTNNFLEYNMNETGSEIKTALREDPKESTPEKEKLYYPEREIPEELGEDTVKELSEEDIDNIISQVFTETEQADFSKALMGKQTTKLNKYEKRLAEKIDSKTASKVMDILKKLC